LGLTLLKGSAGLADPFLKLAWLLLSGLYFFDAGHTFFTPALPFSAGG